MARPATTQDITALSEDWIEYALQTALTANVPTTVIARKTDQNEQYTIESAGTNGGADITLQIKNKNDQFGEDVNGFLAPIVPLNARLQLRIPFTFVGGDHFHLFATSAAGATNIKFDVRGYKTDKSGM